MARAAATPRSPTGLLAASPRTTAQKSPRAMGRTLLRVRNVLKSWALLFGLSAVLGIVPLLTGNYRLLSIFLFCAVLLAGAGYFYIDRITLGMVGARELPRGEAPAFYSTVERLATAVRTPAPNLFFLTQR